MGCGICKAAGSQCGAKDVEVSVVETAAVEPKELEFYLAGVKGESLPKVDSLAEPCKPLFDGSIDVFREQYKEDEQILRRLRNKVKQCTSCKKACAYTITYCNSCSASLEDVGISYNDNIFMGFVHGVARGKYEYMISVRHQNEDILCFDDKLSLSVCHFNCIPTKYYIPDLRYLFLNPEKGLVLIDQIFRIAADAALQQFWDNEAFRKKLFAGRERPKDYEEMASVVLAGMNFPPSMYQLHLQFIHPPMLPFHYNLVCKNQHFHKNRFFPLEYMRAALKLGQQVERMVTDDTSIEEIVSSLRDLGVDYDKIYGEFMAKVHNMQKLFSGAFAEPDFSYKVCADGKIQARVNGGGQAAVPQDVDAVKLKEADERELNSYGRPYANGMPSGTYYKYAKQPKEVKDFPGCI